MCVNCAFKKVWLAACVYCVALLTQEVQVAIACRAESL